MFLSVSKITNSIKKPINLFGLALTLLVLLWTYYSVYSLWSVLIVDLCKDSMEIRFCSTWRDLSNALTLILIGILFFFLIINPLHYNPQKNILKTLLLLPIFLSFTIYTMLGTWHAGKVNSIHFSWWFFMTLIDIGLIIIGLIFNWQKKR